MCAAIDLMGRSWLSVIDLALVLVRSDGAARGSFLSSVEGWDCGLRVTGKVAACALLVSVATQRSARSSVCLEAAAVKQVPVTGTGIW
jgi:hypothetical protein